MIVVTRSFLKSLSHFSWDLKQELISLISKHERGLSKNFILLKEDGSLLIYKGYLDGKRVRITVAKTKNKNYIPLEILKKESKQGYNIRDDYNAATVVDRINKEILLDDYETWELLK